MLQVSGPSCIEIGNTEDNALCVRFTLPANEHITGREVPRESPRRAASTGRSRTGSPPLRKLLPRHVRAESGL
jgi:hypothetical protein